jgi:hypothetical protein
MNVTVEVLLELDFQGNSSNDTKKKLYNPKIKHAELQFKHNLKSIN